MTHDLSPLRELFNKTRKGISAIGDEIRQIIILVLMEGPDEGMRVGDITAHTHLSQPAVSHHLKILCDANLLSLNKVGTMNYYQLNPDKEAITDMLHLCQGILEVMVDCESDNENNKWSSKI